MTPRIALSALMASDSVGDPSASRTVYLTVVLLTVLAIVFVVLAVWMFRRTRPDHELLAPLEEMERRKWRRLDPAGQRRVLDDARPVGALPLKRSATVPNVDQEFSAARPVRSFEDLAGDRLDAEGVPTELGDVVEADPTESVEVPVENDVDAGEAVLDEQTQPVELLGVTSDNGGSDDDSPAGDPTPEYIAADDLDTIRVDRADDETDVGETDVDETDVDETDVDETDVGETDEVADDVGGDDGVADDDVAADDEVNDDTVQFAEVQDGSSEEPSGDFEEDVDTAGPVVDELFIDGDIADDDADDGHVPVVPGEGLLRRPRGGGA